MSKSVLQRTRDKMRKKWEAGHKNCHYCKRKTENYDRKNRGPGGNHWTIDHVIPASKGGKNNINNMVLACAKCNSVRGDIPYEDFKKLVYDEESLKKFNGQGKKDYLRSKGLYHGSVNDDRNNKPNVKKMVFTLYLMACYGLIDLQYIHDYIMGFVK